jgi:hypothetical protein
MWFWAHSLDQQQNDSAQKNQFFLSSTNWAKQMYKINYRLQYTIDAALYKALHLSEGP